MILARPARTGHSSPQYDGETIVEYGNGGLLVRLPWQSLWKDDVHPSHSRAVQVSRPREGTDSDDAGDGIEFKWRLSSVVVRACDGSASQRGRDPKDWEELDYVSERQNDDRRRVPVQKTSSVDGLGRQIEGITRREASQWRQKARGRASERASELSHSAQLGGLACVGVADYRNWRNGYGGCDSQMCELEQASEERERRELRLRTHLNLSPQCLISDWRLLLVL
ncbi:hypothetical protein FB45DRAFT_864247 [Roridomyces roridus]|uniref:Uncharacterized protein n=1 Tax=Roridomyces roridus TaxID=1738132 RepID=A0AAD7FS77_9AGAR|nr:hypothetical protein FB45DRAFT_864247 [Roridomyces roridus]